MGMWACVPLSVQEAWVCGTGSTHWEGHTERPPGAAGQASQVIMEEEGLRWGKGRGWVSSRQSCGFS